MNQPERIGRYKILHVIGKGAAGVVYRAHDPLIGRDVAVKILRDDLEDDRLNEEFRRRFLREARAVGRLSHPAIVTIHDVGEDQENERAFIAMEYLDGKTLREVCSSGDRYDAHRAAELAATLAEALDYAHEMGVIHRDVKPANIILTAGGNLKITDFGIARLDTSDFTADGSVIGTPNYMSPEQIRGEPADQRSDLYSLGVILFELVTGQRLFSASSLPELSVSIATRPAPDPGTLCPGLPRSLCSIINRCLAKNPADRFQTGTELAHSLRNLDEWDEQVDVDGGPSSSLDKTVAVDGHGPSPPAPLPLNIVATQLSGAAVVEGRIPDPSPRHRLTAAAARVMRAKRLWPLAAFAVLLVVIVIGLLTIGGGRSPQPQGEPAISAGGAEPESSAAPAQTGSTLVVLHKNRMSVAYISLSVDGTKVWSQGMTTDKSIERISGVHVQQSIPIPEGAHEIEVHISCESMDVEAGSSIEGVFQAGQTRRLEVSVNPFTEKLKLAWVD